MSPTGRHLRAIPHWVYRQWGFDGRLLYIGATADPETRGHQHTLGTAWYHEIERVELTQYPTGPAAYAAEKLAIRTESPKYNIKSNPANTGILPPGSWLLKPAAFSRLVWETVNAREGRAA
jgi:predicted GIY-YIG superfamily endonuclease